MCPIGFCIACKENFSFQLRFPLIQVEGVVALLVLIWKVE